MSNTLSRATSSSIKRGTCLTGLVVALLLIVGQSGLMVANAGTSDRSSDPGSIRDTTVVGPGGSGAWSGGSASIAKRDTRRDGSVIVQGAHDAIESSQIDYFEGQIAGKSDWTPGNLCQGNGICYKELENVPHRIGLDGLTAGTEYTFTILLDAFDGAGHPGYANLNGAAANSGVQWGTLSVQRNANTASGCGQSTTCLSYTFTFTASGTTAEIGFNAQLAIGAHLFGGSSLSARVDGAAKNVPLPVGNILLDIQAHKFNDLNGNGTQDAGEPDLAGWTMTLYSGPSCAGNPVNVTGNDETDLNPGVTGASGNVDWTNLSASDGDKDGNFSVKETLQGGWLNTTPLCQTVGIVQQQNLATFGNQQQIAEINVEKSSTTESITAVGQVVPYTFVVTNSGNVTLTGITVTDPNCGSAPAYKSGDTNDDSKLQTTEAWTYTCSHTVTQAEIDAGGDLSNTVTADSVESAPDTDSYLIPISTTQTLSLVKSATPSTYSKVGDIISYSYLVKNTGNVTLAGPVTVTDDKATVTCPAGGLAPGASMTCTASYTITQADLDAASVKNTAQAHANGTDSNFDDETVTAAGTTQTLSLVKLATPSTYSKVGDIISYSYVVTNTGNVTLAGPVTVTDDKATVTCPAGGLAPGASMTCTASYTITQADLNAASVKNTAQAHANGTDSNFDDETVTAVVVPPPPPPPPAVGGIQIDKTGPASAHVGDTITYSFAVSLVAGSSGVNSVSVSDPMCDAGTLTSPTKTGGDQDTTLEQGEVWSYSCKHAVAASDSDPLPNTATVSGVDVNGHAVSDSDSHEVDIIHPEITIMKNADPTEGSPGDRIKYTYTVTNSGDVTLYDVSVDDDILGHVCDIAQLGPGQTARCTASYIIPDDADITVTNVVIAVATDPLGLEVRGEDEATIDVVLGATVTPTKSPPGGVAFTGTSAAIPLGGIALLFLTVGTALMWVGRRREKGAVQ